MKQGICYIVGAGEDFGLDFVPGDGDYVIAADGGYARLTAAGITPNQVIGDFDSLGRVPQAKQVTVLPREKDVTDTWAAMELGIQQGYGRFRLYGCTGGRVDHTLSNLQTVAHAAILGLECMLVDEHQNIAAIHNGSISFPAGCTGYVSIVAHSDRCRDVTLEGFQYTLTHGELTNDYPLGISNEFLGGPARMTVGQGTALVVWDRTNGPAQIICKSN